MKEEMININANLLNEPSFTSFERDSERVEVVNFTLVKKYGKGKVLQKICFQQYVGMWILWSLFDQTELAFRIGI